MTVEALIDGDGKQANKVMKNEQKMMQELFPLNDDDQY
jgi:hypothetical protein